MNDSRGMRPPALAPRRLFAGAVRLYQVLISPLLPNRCRFYPSCSEYARQAILRHGVIVGVARGVRRLLRCHPWSAGGYDPVN